MSKQNNVKKSHKLFKKGLGVIRLSKKLHSGKHVDDVQGEHSLDKEEEVDPRVVPSVSSLVTVSVVLAYFC